ncbi:polyprenyl synthetase family protein [Streptomyces monticola]|uniref:Polyprenyl synthetase family protein n=1 Tax=Streptomyces monticola TaxID=2666263 RepID=A0ABW2JU12_9ACTN
MTTPALRGWGGRLPREMGRLAGYHLGWLDEHGRPTADQGAVGGKAVRPALAYVSAEAVGGRATDAVGAAVAVELAHNFSLVHDDVIDGDALRRHRSTLWAAFGMPSAVLAGDALHTLALQVLAESPAPGAGRSVGVLADAVLELIEGEAMDTFFEQRRDVSVGEYRSMARGKTGALMGAACELGALSGGAGEVRAEHLGVFGRHLGVAFQITDDLLGLYGDQQVTGKPVGNDITARKKTYPLLAALQSGGDAAARLGELLHQPGRLEETHVKEALHLIEAAGGRRTAQRAAHRELEHAFAALTAADPTPAAVEQLTALAHLMTHRHH